MLERLDAAVTAALQPLQTAMDGKAADEVVQPLAQVSLRGRTKIRLLTLFHLKLTEGLKDFCCNKTERQGLNV